MIQMNVFIILKRNFPVINWLSEYNIEKVIADFVAGITIGLTLIPQCIAYASLAGLSAEYGLYSSLCGGFIYAAFGTIPELNIAPTALLSLLTLSYTSHLNFGKIHAVVLLCFLSGVIELLCGLLHLGFLVDFVSTPVVAAFTSAGAITIASAQVKNLLGLKFTADNFTTVWVKVFHHISETQKWDAILGFSCCGILLLMRKLKDFGSPPLDNPKQNPTLFKKLIWFISVARNAVVVITCAILAYCLELHDIKPFHLTSKVPAGLPNLTLPIFNITENNQTITTIQMMKELGSGIFVIPFIAILGNVAIAKAFANGKAVDATQEMIAVGLCNLIGSFVGSYPVNASFSRAAVSNASGVRTPLAGIYTGIMVILALTFLTPYFSFIPKATLAAVIISAVVFMIEITLMKMIWTINKRDLVPFFITLIACLLLGIEIGILIGTGVDLLFLLHSTARPKILIEKITTDNNLSYLKIIPTSAVLFPSAEYVREKIMRLSLADKSVDIIVIDCHRINKLDFTSAKCFEAFIEDFIKINKQVIFYQPNESVTKIINNISSTNSIRIVNNESNLQEILKGHQTAVFTIEIDASSCENMSTTTSTTNL